MIAAIKKKYIISRGSIQLELEFFVFFAFSLCKVSYLWIKSVISGLGCEIRNSLLSVSHASLEGCTWHWRWSDCCWMLFHSIFFDCFFTTSGSQVRHLYICDFHKNFIQSVRNKRKRKTSDDGGDSPEHDTDVPEVDLFQLQVNTLRRYKRHYKLQTRPGLNKAQLAETVSRHFRNIPVNEKETLAYFIYMVKNNKSRLDQKSEGSKQLDWRLTRLGIRETLKEHVVLCILGL